MQAWLASSGPKRSTNSVWAQHGARCACAALVPSFHLWLPGTASHCHYCCLPPLCPHFAPAGKYHDALVKDIRGSTAAYGRWNLPAEWFGCVHEPQGLQARACRRQQPGRRSCSSPRQCPCHFALERCRLQS